MFPVRYRLSFLLTECVCVCFVSYSWVVAFPKENRTRHILNVDLKLGLIDQGFDGKIILNLAL
jgi:hypothetical protein